MATYKIAINHKIETYTYPKLEKLNRHVINTSSLNDYT